MATNKWIYAGLAILSSWGLAQAEPETTPLSLADAMERALSGNLAVVQAETAMRSAEAGVVGAKSAFDPTLSVSGSATQSRSTRPFGNLIYDQDSTRLNGSTVLSGRTIGGSSYELSGNLNLSDSQDLDYQRSFALGEPLLIAQLNRSPSASLTLRQDVLRGYLMSYNKRQVVSAESSLSIAKLQKRAQTMRTLRDVARAYWTWSAAEESARIAQNRVEIAEESLRIGELQFSEGRSARVDVTRLKTELVRAKKALTESRHTAANQRDSLLVLVGMEPGTAYTPSSNPIAPTGKAPTEQEAIETARTSNVDLLVLQAELDQAELDLKMARHGRLPSLQLSGTANLSQPFNKVGEQPSSTTNNQSFSGSATFTMPLGNRAARSDVIRSEATLFERRATLESRQRDILANVAQQARVFASAQEQIVLADLEVALAEETLAAEEARASLGRAVQRDVLEARTAVFDAKRQAAQARTDLELAYAELMLLQGKLEHTSFQFAE